MPHLDEEEEEEEEEDGKAWQRPCASKGSIRFSRT
jgi:hypothetical protein